MNSKSLSTIVLSSLLLFGSTKSANAVTPESHYTPTKENLEERKAFNDAKFGIFLHWGIYSMFGQGEWYLETGGLTHEEYSKVASAFYPIQFDARRWVRAFKDAGAKYICITTRHHDGFSMFNTRYSDYNIVKATPFHRDIIKELAEACKEEGIRLHLYYSHLDWGREDYPIGRTGHKTARKGKSDWNSYFNFMNNQLTELLTNYGKIGAIWFDGVWDHDHDKTPFNWHLKEQYELIHSLQPACLIGNNHHLAVNEGEDFQMFERDLPGENTTGYAKNQSVGHLPLETCQTMNGMWGYKVKDQNYKSSKNLIHLLVNSAGKGANLLINIGPQPNGLIPATALDRLKEIGKWMRKYGSTIYGTTEGYFKTQKWGCSTLKGDTLFVHILKADTTALSFPLDKKIRKAVDFDSNKKIKFEQKDGTVTLILDKKPTEIDKIITITTK